jgi:hypothetical protein
LRLLLPLPASGEARLLPLLVRPRPPLEVRRVAGPLADLYVFRKRCDCGVESPNLGDGPPADARGDPLLAIGRRAGPLRGEVEPLARGGLELT